jgi:acyl-CoA reductase-like NAD-dependent aldehyde dehydrogenase
VVLGVQASGLGSKRRPRSLFGNGSVGAGEVQGVGARAGAGFFTKPPIFGDVRNDMGIAQEGISVPWSAGCASESSQTVRIANQPKSVWVDTATP